MPPFCVPGRRLRAGSDYPVGLAWADAASRTRCFGVPALHSWALQSRPLTRLDLLLQLSGSRLLKPRPLVMHLVLTTWFVALCRYGLTSVDLPSYVAGSWLGMLPGTIAYVCAGNYGRQMIDSDEPMGGPAGWQIAVGLAVTVAALAYIGKVAQKALKEVEEEDEQSA